jgi:hypothetical protein
VVLMRPFEEGGSDGVLDVIMAMWPCCHGWRNGSLGDLVIFDIVACSLVP